MLSNALLSASYFILWDDDESGVQVTASSSQSDHDAWEEGPPLSFVPFPANLAKGVFNPAPNVRPLYQNRVAYSPPSRAPPALAL